MALSDHIPDVPAQVGAAVKKVYASGEAGRKSGVDIADGFFSGVSRGIAEAGKQSLFVLPFNLLVRPIAGMVNEAARRTAGFTLGFTGSVIRTLPIFPFPRTNTPSAPSASPETPSPLASAYERIDPPPSFHGPGDLGIGPRQTTGSPDAEPGSAGRSA